MVFGGGGSDRGILLLLPPYYLSTRIPLSRRLCHVAVQISCLRLCTDREAESLWGRWVDRWGVVKG